MSVDKLVDSTQLDADLTSVANAIRAKRGGNDTLAFPSGFVSEIGEIETGYALNDIVNNIEPSGELVIDGPTTIRQYQFLLNQEITKVSSPTVIAICGHAFQNCFNLEEVSFPNCIYIGEKTNAYASTANYDYQHGSSFAGCKRIRKAYFPNVQIISDSRPFGADDSWYYGDRFGSVFRPSLAFPSLTYIGAQAFRQGDFSVLDFGPGLSRIESYCIYNCSLDALVLRKSDDIVEAANTNAISSVNTVYCPSNLISEYEAATNWSAKTRTYLPIEGSIYETQYADGTPIE